MRRLKVPNTIRVPLQVAACILFTPLFTAVYIEGQLITSESKKPGQIAVVYHYCDLSRFFLTQTLLQATYVLKERILQI